MSKPNLLGFSSSVGIYRNKRIREVRKMLLETVKKTVPFADLAPTLFQSLMAYAAENQIDGDFSSYKPADLAEVFTVNNIPVNESEAAAIQRAFADSGLIEAGKIRSWNKFNRHLGEYEKIVKGKRKAALFMHKKREREMREKEKAEKAPSPALSPEKPKATPKEPSPVARAISLRKLMESHPGAPNAVNAPTDRDELRLKKSEYRTYKVELDRLDAQIAGFSKAA